MAAVMNGIALHGGVIGACGTFFVFSDYMKPAVRMAALMELPVKYIWTHDAFRVGEDGPTHEPVEQEAQLRLMEELRNFNGEPSMLVLRPADAAETSVAWAMAMENFKTPSALVLSRQNLPDLPAASGDRFAEANAGCRKGGYTVVEAENPDVILVANGSEVSLLCEVAEKLAAEGKKARVVSVPSLGLFFLQDADYRKSVMTPGVPAFGLTAGLPLDPPRKSWVPTAWCSVLTTSAHLPPTRCLTRSLASPPLMSRDLSTSSSVHKKSCDKRRLLAWQQKLS